MESQNFPSPLEGQCLASCCYFFVQNHSKCLLPIISNKYEVNIKNKFAEIKSIQKYFNPFTKPLQIHYAIPVDPTYALTKLEITYKNTVVQGSIKSRQVVKAEYIEAKNNGDTVMMAVQEKKDASVMNVRVGNIDPNETVQIEFNMIGQLKCELENALTLRIPSHIAPRYKSQVELLNDCFKKLFSGEPEVEETYLNTKTEWDFSIHLNCTEQISSYKSDSHKLITHIISMHDIKFQLDGAKVAQVDLEFTYSHQKPYNIFCTAGKKCAAVTFHTPASKKSKYSDYKGEYIFLLDRSGSMDGKRIEQAIEALVLFLMSLPEHSYFNIISFGSQFDRLYPKSLKYSDANVEKTIKLVERFSANYGGTQITAPLQDILKEKGMKKGYRRHVIVLTDGQVSDTESVISIIKTMNQKMIATTHMVGIGNGVSFNMIERGAKEGGGQKMFIMDAKQMKKQIIFLLQNITACQIKDFKLTFNQKLIEATFPLIPSVLKKGRQNTFYLKLKNQLSLEELINQKIILTYLDQEDQKEEKVVQLSLQPQNWIEDLNKYQASIQIYDLIKQNTFQSDQQATKLSLSEQVLCKFTGYICKIKENASPNLQEGYLLKMKNFLQGNSLIRTRMGQIFVKTLKGITITLRADEETTVQELKDLIQEKVGTLSDQQRLIFGGRQLQDGRRLTDYKIYRQSTIHMVLRIRGGGLSLSINIPGLQQPLSKAYQATDSIEQIYSFIFNRLPMLKKVKFELTHNGRILDKKKKISDYGISHSSEIKADVPEYMFTSKGVLKMMKISGYWQCNQLMIKDLELEAAFNKWLGFYGAKKKDMAMTKTMKEYLEVNYQSEKEQLSLIYDKINTYLGQTVKA